LIAQILANFLTPSLHITLYSEITKNQQKQNNSILGNSKILSPHISVPYFFHSLRDNIDGAPPHYAVTVRNWLDEVFPDRWMGRGTPRRPAPIAWPPYFWREFWSYLKCCCFVFVDFLLFFNKVLYASLVSKKLPESWLRNKKKITAKGGEYKKLWQKQIGEKKLGHPVF